MARSPKQANKVAAAAAPDTPTDAPARRGPSRGVLLAACALLCAVVAFGYAGSAWASLLYRLLVDGGVLMAWLGCAAGVGSAVLVLLPLGGSEPPSDARGTSSLSPVLGGEGRGEGQPRRATSVADSTRAFGPAPLPNPLPGVQGRGSQSGDLLLHLVTATALGIGIFSLATLGLGLAGWLNRVTVVGLLAAGAMLGPLVLFRSPAWRRRAGAGEAVSDWLRTPAALPSWLWLAAMPFLGLAVIAALLPPGVLWPQEPHWYDVVEYHLQIPREWYELGRIVPLRHNAFSFFPFNVEVQFLLAMHLRGGPWAGMYLAHFLHLAMVVLTVAAVHGFARRTSGSHGAATIASVAVATVPWMAQLGAIAYNEGGLLLFGTLAMGWAFDAVVRPARRLGRFPVAGLLAGFACGSKLTGVPEVLFAVGGLSALGILLDHRKSRVRSEEQAEPRIEPHDSGENDVRKSVPLRPQEGERAAVPLALRLAGVATFFLAGVLAFAPWLIRNQVWAGNPVFPEAARLLGQAHFSDAQVERWEQAHSPRPDQRSPAARAKAWWSQVWTNWQYGYVLLPLGLAAGVAACLLLTRRGRRTGYSDVLENVGMWAFLLIALFVALSVVWLVFTHLQGRFFILGVPIAGMLLALLTRRGWVGMTVVAALVLLAAVPAYARLHLTFGAKLHEPDWRMLVGLHDFERTFVPVAYDDALNSDAPLALVGEARAFRYVVPMSRLSYRTVFDVDAKPGESVIDAWAAGAPPGAWRLVDPDELRRFIKTYRGIPPMPPEYVDAKEPFLIPPAPAGSPGG